MNILSRTHLRRVAAIAALVVAGTATVGVLAAGPHAGMGGMGAADMMPMMGRGMDQMLGAVNASAEQKAQIDQIRQAARADLQAQHDAGRALRDQAMQLFTQPTVDANAAEVLRKKMLAQHDSASQRMMQAMLEVSRVLSPEQRQQMAALMKQRGDMMKQHHMKPRTPAAKAG